MIALAGCLLLLTLVAMAQARRMSSIRRRALTTPTDTDAVVSIRRGAAVAGALRGLMGATTLAIVGLMAAIIGR